MTDTPAIARKRLDDLVSEFFDRAEKLIAARAEFERRYRDEWQRDWAGARDPAEADPDFVFDSPEGLLPSEQKKLDQIKRRAGARVTGAVCKKYGLSNLHDPPRLEIAAVAGLGKTQAVIAEIMKRPEWWTRNVWIFEPTLAMAERIAKQFGPGPQVQVVRGRNAPNPLGPDDDAPAPMCRKPKAADLAGRLGLPVSKTVCNNGEKRCQFYDECAYLKQRNDSRGIRVFASEYLHLPKPGHLAPPDLVIIDEAVVSTLISETPFGLDRLSGSPEWFDDPAVAREVGAVLDGLRSAFQSGEPLLAA
ncbi:MAG: hypothetical protein ACREFD_07430, partial [Stellaceae bacterium]